jgi:DNA-binding sugar fermentation-stimulating protein
MSTTQKQIKMAVVIDTRMKQRVVTEFLTAGQVSPIEIRRRLKSVHGAVPLM